METLIPKQLQCEFFRFLKLRPKGKEPTYDMGGWQKKNYQYNDPNLLKHLEQGGNYGIIGGFGRIILIDSDSEEIAKIADTLPETFTVKTGSPEEYKKHYFYILNKAIKPIRLSKEHVGDLGDVRSSGQYVVAPNSLHPKGDYYRVIKDIPITEIDSDIILDAFKDYVSPMDNSNSRNGNAKLSFEPSTKLRNTNFIRHCSVPDYCRENKVKGNTSKNWKLFPYVVDILHNRQSSIKVYEEILKKQGHSTGAIAGWIKNAQDGKLMKCSCKKMQEYLKYYHKEKVEEICGGCPLYKKIQLKEKIENNIDLNELQKEVLLNIASKNPTKATELIVDAIKIDNNIYTTRDDVKTEMWIYKDGIYVPQGKTYIKEFCRNILGESYTTYLSNNVISKIETDTYIEQKAFFEKNYIYEVPVLNGILNIKTKELSGFTPEKIFFNKLPIEYDKSTECPSIIQHLKTILKTEEDVNVVLEIFAYMLLKEYRIEKAFMFLGNGRNGKSKTIELMRNFIGAENCSSLSLKSLNDENFSLHELFGKMANLSADLSRTDLKETGMIKSLIGRDTIQAKRKFLNDIHFTNHAKMIFACNELPKIYDTTDGFWTKWVLIEFPNQFINKSEFDKLNDEDKKTKRIIDTSIIEKITSPEELSGLLNILLEKLQIILENQDFSYSKTVKETKDMWIRKSDSFTAFCYDNIIEDFDSSITKKILRRQYSLYCKSHRVSGCSDKSIKITLENLFGVIESQNSNYDRIWEGIKLK